MKLCMVYSPRDSKLRAEGAYCSVFKDMFHALIKQFNCWKFITSDCSVKDLDADVIFFFDPHATHHIKLEGIENHPAVKIEYWNDLHQQEISGISITTGEQIKKLGAESRVRRFEDRESNYIVSPVKYFFLERFPQLEKNLIHFPHAPKAFKSKPYLDRNFSIIGNGATHGGWGGCYDFRQWAFEQPEIEHVPHWLHDKKTPMGEGYLTFLSGFMGALALCSTIPVPKYYEIPMAGCVSFAEYHKEYEELGFKDYESCVYVNKDNFKDRVRDFYDRPLEYQRIADNGKKVMENYTADKFAEYVYTICGIAKSEKAAPPRPSHFHTEVMEEIRDF